LLYIIFDEEIITTRWNTQVTPDFSVCILFYYFIFIVSSTMHFIMFQ